MAKVAADLDEVFANDILEGLSLKNKRIPSRYLYDGKGDQLFQQIMELPEYYLTRSEREILSSYKDQIYRTCCASKPFRLVDLGAGDGSKTSVLIEHFLREGVGFEYMPVDISEHSLDTLSARLIAKFPSLRIRSVRAEYSAGVKKLSAYPVKKLVLFLGSNLGNFPKQEGVEFLRSLANSLNSGDYLLIGLDLKKDPQTILNAYSDSRQVTAEFNYNLLDRINRELDADFDRKAFTHYASYDPVTGEVKSYLVSLHPHSVHIRACQAVINFRRWEAIHTEYSTKYSIEEIPEMAEASGFVPEKNFIDSKGYFVDSLWKRA